MRQLVSDTSSRLDALCGGASGPVGIAVSGGGDSMALLHLALQWRAPEALFAFTVNHGLRVEAEREAEFVKAYCLEFGVAHKTLVWTPPKRNISQARARDARHRMLAAALRQRGGTHLLLGHTLDDQYETAFMRAKRSETGLAGMRELSVSPVWPEGRGVFLARPLLSCTRAGLRQLLKDASEVWVDDPSNADLKFERVRARKTLLKEGVGAVKTLYEAAVSGRNALDLKLFGWLENHVEAHADGLVVCQPNGLEAPDFAAGLGHLLLVASGSDKLAPFAARLELATDILHAPRKWRSRTLGGAWLAPRQGHIHIARDPGLVEPIGDAAKAHSPYIWDGRFEITQNENRVKSVETDFVSALAKPSYPMFADQHDEVRCLVQERLDSVKWILGHETCVYA